MEVYIANFSEEINFYQEEEKLYVYFSGSDFKKGLFQHQSLREFKSDYLIDIRNIKQLITPKIKKIILTGGEPLLQRQAVSLISTYLNNLTDLNLSIVLDSHLSKPDAFDYVISKLNNINEIKIKIWYPLSKTDFNNLTSSKTFFKQEVEIIEDIKKSYSLLKNFKGKLIVEIYPNENFMEKEIYNHIKLFGKLPDEIRINSFSNSLLKYNIIGLDFKDISFKKLEEIKDSLKMVFDTTIIINHFN